MDSLTQIVLGAAVSVADTLTWLTRRIPGEPLPPC
jgi:hypothetical protein